ncbi:hypothetical protein [Sphingomonas rubra]|uniref:Hemerythrin HHE cation binding domain-containing protein n=1 Tax=Sphingomonas rubra TaxID=634430 RepID=A0A1I5TY10_9SPHN|nr:hypothetical protein [Sphingomonas rubra]SFP87801.1 hypothetical protein SAMN04488241_109156 [Sphingomonas rubra]
METRFALARLADHQRAIMAQVDDSRRRLRSDGRGAQPHLAKQRWVLMRMLREYQLFKHVEIFDPAIVRGDARRADLARGMKERCVAAGEDYQRHVALWTGEAIHACWADYAAAVIALADRLAQHVARERCDVEMLLDGTERTRRSIVRVSG